MPVYEYICEKCQHPFEQYLKSSDAAPEPCPKCGSGQLRKLYSVFGLQIGSSGGGGGG